MGRVIRSPKSKIDLWEIGDHIAQDNVLAAVKFLDQVDDTLSKLSDFPGLGPRREELLPGIRSLPIGNYVLFYRLAPGGIEVVRVFHGARDISELFER